MRGGPAPAGNRGPAEPRAGLALLVVLLVTLALVLLGHAALLMADTEVLISRMERRRVTEEHGRRAALRELAGRADTLPRAGLHVTTHGEVRVERPSAELALLMTPEETPGPVEGAARLLYAPDPLVRARARVHAVQAGGATFRAGVAPATALQGDLCPDGVRDPMGGRPVNPGPGPGSGPGGDSPWPGIGLLPPGLLADRLPGLSGGRLELPADPAGEPDCAAGTLPWGDPGRPGSACAGRWGRGGSTADLSVAGGGQGLLVVQGDLTLEAGASFRGWVLVTGRLRLGPGARFAGVADVGADVVLDGGSELLGDRCAGALALVGVPGLRRPWLLGPSGWPILLR